MNAELVARHRSNGKSEKVPVSLASPIAIGRLPSSPLKFEERDISWTHFTLELANGQVVLTDQSSSGTKLNGAPVNKGQPRPIRPGAVVELGEWTITVSWEVPATAEVISKPGVKGMIGQIGGYFTTGDRLLAVFSLGGIALVLLYFSS